MSIHHFIANARIAVLRFFAARRAGKLNLGRLVQNLADTIAAHEAVQHEIVGRTADSYSRQQAAYQREHAHRRDLNGRFDTVSEDLERAKRIKGRFEELLR